MRPPTRVKLDLQKIFGEVFGELPTVTKDLQEHERVCPTCHGLTLVKRDMPYGLGDEPGFPYIVEFLGPCPDCYIGVQRLCEFCAQPLRRGYTSGEYWCDCPAARSARAAAEREKVADRRAKAQRVTIDEYEGAMGVMLFDEENEEYLPLGDADPGEYYACTAVEEWIRPDQEDVIERLDQRGVEHWDEFEGIGVSQEGRDELQAVLDAWFKKHVILDDLYYPDYKTIVVVPA